MDLLESVCFVSGRQAEGVGVIQPGTRGDGGEVQGAEQWGGGGAVGSPARPLGTPELPWGATRGQGAVVRGNRQGLVGDVVVGNCDACWGGGVQPRNRYMTGGQVVIVQTAQAGAGVRGGVHGLVGGPASSSVDHPPGDAV